MFIKKYVSKLIILFAIFTIIYLEVTNNIENFSDITMKYYEEPWKITEIYFQI